MTPPTSAACHCGRPIVPEDGFDLCRLCKFSSCPQCGPDTDPAFAVFTDAQLIIVRFCAIECALQVSGERSVYDMLGGWTYAMGRAGSPPTVEDVLRLGAIVEPRKNLAGFRQVGVRVGSDVKGDWQHVPGQIAALCASTDTLSPAEWFYEYEQVHPFRDGNGRTGQVLFNWLSGTLVAPDWAPNYWDDPRRLPNEGAPR